MLLDELQRHPREKHQPGSDPAKLDWIADAIREVMAVDLDTLRSRDRTRRIADARLIGMAIAYHEGFTLLEVADFFNRHHTTVIFARNTVLQGPPELVERAEDVWAYYKVHREQNQALDRGGSSTLRVGLRNVALRGTRSEVSRLLAGNTE